VQQWWCHWACVEIALGQVGSTAGFHFPGTRPGPMSHHYLCHRLRIRFGYLWVSGWDNGVFLSVTLVFHISLFLILFVLPKIFLLAFRLFCLWQTASTVWLISVNHKISLAPNKCAVAEEMIRVEWSGVEFSWVASLLWPKRRRGEGLLNLCKFYL